MKCTNLTFHFNACLDIRHFYISYFKPNSTTQYPSIKIHHGNDNVSYNDGLIDLNQFVLCGKQVIKYLDMIQSTTAK